MARQPGSASGPGHPRVGSFRAGPFPQRVSCPSTASSVLWTSPTPDLSSDGSSGNASPPSPAGDQSGGPGRASHVPTHAVRAWCGLRPRRSDAVSR